MTAEKKQQYGDIDEAKKKLEKDHKFVMTDAEHEASDQIKTENVFKTFMKNFHLEEKDLPVMMFYDPLTKQSGPMYYPVEIKMEDITKEAIIKEANKFIGQWLKPINKSEPRPDNEGKAHKKIVGSNY
jgi:CRISPR/Cas system-associated exonuclease Cas4 (RecB family)